jgi:RNA-directed DNA polymerase
LEPASIAVMDTFHLMYVLGQALLAGNTDPSSALERATQALGTQPPWLPSLAERYVEHFHGGFTSLTRPRLHEVLSFLWNDEDLRGDKTFDSKQLDLKSWLGSPAEMQPVDPAKLWAIASIRSQGELAEWLGLAVGDLDWFANLERRNTPESKLDHYHYRALAKKSGGIRLVEAPKPRLKEIQRRILAEILNAVPVHPAVHGFVRGRSAKTFVSPHTGHEVVLRLDLEDFFPSISLARLQAMFRTMGYPETVANLLGGICSNRAPKRFGIYARPHLPQGAPTSPALANICAYWMDRRLHGLARAAGGTYTRYADDLAFSGNGDFVRRANRFLVHVAAVAMEEGFRVNHRKTRLMRQGVRQHLAGLCLNQKPNWTREDYDRLKATLTNCLRFGLESQNREQHPKFWEHLSGRVSALEHVNPDRGSKLRHLLERIASGQRDKDL